MSTKVIVGLLLTAFMLSLVPLALIARSRSHRSTNRALHLVLDMDKQERFNPQANNKMFADGRAMRPKIEHTIARQDMEIQNEAVTYVAPGTGGQRMVGNSVMKFTISTPEEYAAIMYGRIRAAGTSDEKFKADLPPGAPLPGEKDKTVPADKAFYLTDYPARVIQPDPAQDNEAYLADFIKRGQERYNVNCLPCHGGTGYGDGMVQQRAKALQVSNAAAVALWAQPANLTEDKFAKQPVGKIFNTITNGTNNMPAYDKQISVPDRWAIVMYVRALQASQGGAAPVKTASKDKE